MLSLAHRAFWSEAASVVSKLPMQCHVRLASVTALAILTLACETHKPAANVEWPQVGPPVVHRSPTEGADPVRAFAVWACSPGDSPSELSVYVGSPPKVPHFRIDVFSGALAELSHRTFQWPGDEGFARLQWCPADCERVAAGRVTFGEVQPNRFVEGTIYIGGIQRHFKANWGPRLTGCN